MSDPKPWWKVYSGDKEKRFFVGADGYSGLCRKSGFIWRSTEKLALEAKLTKVEVEEILKKYYKSGIVIQHKSDPEKWGYWERVGKTPDPIDVVSDDIKERVDKVKKDSGLKQSSPVVGSQPAAASSPKPATKKV